MQPYAPRRISFHGLRQPRGWQLKLYGVVCGSGSLEWDAFEPGVKSAQAVLPEPDWTRGRPGVGFLIAHQGRTAHYIILGWWDRENELPLRVFVRYPESHPEWHPARDGESVCVWDLEIISAERATYVDTMLRTETPDLPGYLAQTLPTTALPPR